MKFTRYFLAMRNHPDRQAIELDWIRHVIDHPVRKGNADLFHSWPNSLLQPIDFVGAASAAIRKSAI